MQERQTLSKLDRHMNWFNSDTSALRSFRICEFSHRRLSHYESSRFSPGSHTKPRGYRLFHILLMTTH